MKAYSFLYLTLFVLLYSCTGSSDSKNQTKVTSSVSSSGFITLSTEKLQSLGVSIIDSSVMYNNKIHNVGTLNLVIKGSEYSAGNAVSQLTHYNFYPRYITTLDTIQRYAYNLQGKGANTVEEAQKWATFDKLVPIVVEQQQNGQKFGETLVFWFTRTDSLLMVLKKQ